MYNIQLNSINLISIILFLSYSHIKKVSLVELMRFNYNQFLVYFDYFLSQLHSFKKIN